MDQKPTADYIRVPHRLTPAGGSRPVSCQPLLSQNQDKKEFWLSNARIAGRCGSPPRLSAASARSASKISRKTGSSWDPGGTLLAAYHVTGAREIDPSTGWHPDGQVFNPIGFIAWTGAMNGPSWPMSWRSPMPGTAARNEGRAGLEASKGAPGHYAGYQMLEGRGEIRWQRM